MAFWDDVLLKNQAPKFVLDLFVKLLIEKEDFWRVAKECCPGLRANLPYRPPPFTSLDGRDYQRCEAQRDSGFVIGDEQTCAELYAAHDAYVRCQGETPQLLEVLARLSVGGRSFHGPSRDCNLPPADTSASMATSGETVTEKTMAEDALDEKTVDAKTVDAKTGPKDHG
ncbi:MAG: hypothetical protein M1822_000336 [Bathelium mastoideum]|nr:MAG: hypothetical protein M1822_000336 [Bathelium mastoideum]